MSSDRAEEARAFMDKPLTKRALRKAATRASVIDAARTVFTQHGYGGATISEIAATAGGSPGTVLNAAPTKIALLNDVMATDFEALAADCRTLSASLTSPFRDKIAALLELHLQRHCQELDLFAALLGHSWLDGPAERASLQRNLDRAWAPVLTLAREYKHEAGLKPDCEPETLVAHLQDMYIGVVRRCSANSAPDLFSASAAMRRGLDLALDGALA